MTNKDKHLENFITVLTRACRDIETLSAAMNRNASAIEEQNKLLKQAAAPQQYHYYDPREVRYGNFPVW